MSFSHYDDCGAPWMGHRTACEPVQDFGAYLAPLKADGDVRFTVPAMPTKPIPLVLLTLRMSDGNEVTVGERIQWDPFCDDSIERLMRGDLTRNFLRAIRAQWPKIVL